MRPLALSVASGSISSLLFAVARDLVRGDSLGPLPTGDFCPVLLPEERTGELDLRSVLVGLLLGLAFGPIIDLLYHLRHSWSRWVRFRICSDFFSLAGELSSFE